MHCRPSPCRRHARRGRLTISDVDEACWGDVVCHRHWTYIFSLGVLLSRMHTIQQPPSNYQPYPIQQFNLADIEQPKHSSTQLSSTDHQDPISQHNITRYPLQCLPETSPNPLSTDHSTGPPNGAIHATPQPITLLAAHALLAAALYDALCLVSQVIRRCGVPRGEGRVSGMILAGEHYKIEG